MSTENPRSSFAATGILERLGVLAQEDSLDEPLDPPPSGADGEAGVYAALFEPLSEDETRRILARLQLESEGGKSVDPSPSARGARASTEPRGASPPQGAVRAPSSRRRIFGFLRSTMGLAAAGVLALIFAGTVGPSLVRQSFPEPVPGFVVQEVAQDGVPRPREAPIVLAQTRSIPVRWTLVPQSPVQGDLDCRAFVDSSGTLYPVSSKLSVGSRGEQYVDISLAEDSEVPPGPAALLLFLGRPSQLPEGPDEARDPSGAMGSARAYQVIRADIFVRNR